MRTWQEAVAAARAGDVVAAAGRPVEYRAIVQVAICTVRGPGQGSPMLHVHRICGYGTYAAR